jgi:two-component system, response regulator
LSEYTLRLVIVEDDEHDFELLSRILKKCEKKFEKVWIKNGNEAIEFLGNSEIDAPNSSKKNVFFLDINLPMLDGLELLKMIKGHPSTKEDYVIILTGSNSERDMETANKNGADLYLEKPFGREKIEEFSKLICSKLTSLTLTDPKHQK